MKRSVLTFTSEQLGHWSLTILTVKQGYSVWHVLYFHLHPLLLALSLGTSDKMMTLSSLLCLSSLPPQAFGGMDKVPPQPSLPQANQSQLSQPVLV